MLKFWEIPRLVSRPWRLVPELDKFDDGRCEAFVRDLYGLRLVGLVLALPIALVLGMAVTLAGSVIADSYRDAAWASGETVIGRLAGVVFGVCMIALVSSIALTPYAMLLRRALRGHIARAKCPACSYSLLGLPLVELRSDDDWDPGVETVRCPECGVRISLAEHGLRAEDVLAGVLRPDGTAAQESPKQRRRAAVLFALPAMALAAWAVTGVPEILTAFLLLLLLVPAMGAEWAQTRRGGHAAE